MSFTKYIIMLRNSLEFLHFIVRNYKRPILTLYKYKRNLVPFEVESKDPNNVYTVNNRSQGYYLLHHGTYLNFDSENDILAVPYKDQLLFFRIDNADEVVGDIWNIFYKEDYAFLASSETWHSLVDVGSNVGDSSIYFALNNAVEVIAVEPNPNAHASSKSNIRLNKMEGIIKTFNAALMHENDTVKVLKERGAPLSFHISPSELGQLVIPAIDLETCFNMLQNKNTIYLKLDCEGCEYDSILPVSTDTLRKFSKIQLEYHFGADALEKRLTESGFIVRNSGSTEYFDLEQKRWLSVGFIYATRI